MYSAQLRRQFLDFFEKRGHKIVPSSSLVPEDDPSVLLTSAGVQQFKPYFEGKKNPERDFGSRRLASVQKSFRTTDIDEVGDEMHLTFFEMLGNFSIGDYFKKEAIEMADEFVRKELKVPRSRIKLTVFAGSKKVPKDEESAKIWQSLGYTLKDISWRSMEDNFWGPTGEEGPCGPTTEIYIDGVEVWNLVFNEYYCHKDGSLEPLDKAGGNQGVDTGLGLERTVMVLERAESVFDIDLFAPLIKAIDELVLRGAGKRYSRSREGVLNGQRHPGSSTARFRARGSGQEVQDRLTPRSRIIADHLRAAVFLIADGVAPSNQKQGYILRRLIRRLYSKGKEIGISKTEDFLGLLEVVINTYRDCYSELASQQKRITQIFGNEVNKFKGTLERGLNRFNKLVSQYSSIIPGKEVFFLYESFGFPLEFTKELAKEQGLKVDIEGFQRAKEEHRRRSRG